MAGLANKDKKLWEGLKNWDAMVLSETWVEEKGKKVREKFTERFIWGWQTATRKHLKGKAKEEW